VLNRSHMHGVLQGSISPQPAVAISCNADNGLSPYYRVGIMEDAGYGLRRTLLSTWLGEWKLLSHKAAKVMSKDDRISRQDESCKRFVEAF
jgi:hypothetical protein